MLDENNMNNKVKSSIAMTIYVFIYFFIIQSQNITISIIIFLLTISINLIQNIIIDVKYKRDIEKIPSYDYWRNLDFKYISPVEAGTLLGVNKIGTNTFIAIIFELEKKGIITMEQDSNDVYISLNDCTLEKIDELKIYESKIVKLIFTSSEDKERKRISQIMDIFDNTNKKVLLESIYKSIKKNIYSQYYYGYIDYVNDNGKNFLTLLIPNILLVNVMFSWISILLIIKDIQPIGIFSIVLYFIQIMLFIIIMKKRYIKDKYIHEVNKLKGLYKYINEFSTINEKSLEYYSIYQNYFVYAIGMGLADRMEKEVKNNNEIWNSIDINMKVFLECDKIMRGGT